MGFLDRFRKTENRVSLPQLCYDVAYFVLPHFAYNDLGKFLDLCNNTPSAAGPFFYVMACQLRKVEPDIDDARRLTWRRTTLDETLDYYVLEYPTPPPVDLGLMSAVELFRGKNPPVLAPYFSAIVHETSTGDVSYYILGQSPLGGGTTLRTVLREGMNCNLGPGPEPRLEDFLTALAQLREAGPDSEIQP